MSAQHLFVYGTLQPGRPNAHLLERIGGSWHEAHVFGHLHEEGWGATMGYPAIRLDENGPRVDGYVFSSEALESHWPSLDAFEGAAYKRTLVNVTLGDGQQISAHIYQLNPSFFAKGSASSAL